MRSVLPDGFFWMDLGDGRERHCFFELDNCTLTLNYTDDNPKDFAQKIRTMSAFYRSGRFRQLFPEAGESMWYLTVTTGSRRRMENLKATAEQVIGLHNRALDRYWFACMEDFPTWQDPFSTAPFERVWMRGGEEEKWSLDEERKVNVKEG